MRTRALLRVTLAYAIALGAALVLGFALRGQHPVLVAALCDLAATIVVFAFSVGLDNSSVYDPYWSVAPVPIVIFWMWPVVSARQVLVLTLVSIWAVRLTANWIRRWRGLSDEDFRYVEIRGRTGRGYWPASFFSIHLFPTVWVFLGCLPLFTALTAPRTDLGIGDLAAALVTLAAIAIEWIADRQLFRFLKTRARPEEICSTGLWAVSRHPNYFGEVLFWWGLFAFGLAAGEAPWWIWPGPIAITALFVFVSVPWMDRRMLRSRPAYAERLRNVSGLVPWWQRRDSVTVSSPRR